MLKITTENRSERKRDWVDHFHQSSLQNTDRCGKQVKKKERKKVLNGGRGGEG